MGRINGQNLKKTIDYLRRNGVGSTLCAVRERLQGEGEAYAYQPPSPKELERQRTRRWEEKVRFTVLVPAYRTPEPYFRQMVRSVLDQTYPCFTLLVADAGGGLEEICREFGDRRIRYQRLEGNRGIAENTNAGLALAEGEYTALLDHDDMLAPDALYEMASAVCRERGQGREPWMLYSDEDKCDGEGKRFYEPNRKADFDPELLMTNNYICHLTALRTSLARELLLRGEYDGAQDYDLFLRAAQAIRQRGGAVCHIPRVLYHWRCHEGSTAANPRSKAYAYEAGRRALQDYIDRQGWRARAVDLPHRGFYRVEYQGGLFRERPEIAAVGGRVLDRRGRIIGGIMDGQGRTLFQGLPDGYSGPMHRAALTQSAQALDIRCLELREECRELWQEISGFPYEADPQTGLLAWRSLPADTDYRELSLRLSRELAARGCTLLWDPQRKERV